MKSQDYGIDVLEIIKHLVNRGWIIVLCTVIAAVAVMPVMGLMPQKSQMQALLAVYTRPGKFVTDIHVSGAIGSLLGDDATIQNQTQSSDFGSSMDDGAQLVSLLSTSLKSEPMLEQIIEELDLTITAPKLARQITITRPEGTNFVQIKVSDKDGEQARRICQTLVDHVQDVLDTLNQSEENVSYDVAMAPSVVNDGKAAGILRTTAMGAAIGFVLSAGVFFVQYFMDTRVYKKNDLEELLDMKVLSVIPAPGKEDVSHG